MSSQQGPRTPAIGSKRSMLKISRDRPTVAALKKPPFPVNPHLSQVRSGDLALWHEQ